MAVLTVTGGSIAVVELREQWTSPAAAVVSAGRAVYQNATTGWATVCGSANAAHGITLNEATYVGQPVTCIRQGMIELGDAAIQSLNYGATVYVHGDLGGTATGTLGTTGTVGGTLPVGTVVAVHGGHTGAVGGTVTARKLLRVSL